MSKNSNNNNKKTVTLNDSVDYLLQRTKEAETKRKILTNQNSKNKTNR